MQNQNNGLILEFKDYKSNSPPLMPLSFFLYLHTHTYRGKIQGSFIFVSHMGETDYLVF